MSRDPHPFHIPPERFETDGRVRFGREETHHMLDVLRMRVGDSCRVVDGRGGRFKVVLEGSSKDLTGLIVETAAPESRAGIMELGFPILRLRARTEWLIEKAVEVGVDRLVPIRWTRSVAWPGEGVRARWDRIAREAMKQCERAWLPEVAGFEEPIGEGATTVILADPEGASDLPSLEGSTCVRLLVGPEGGPTDQERANLVARGCRLWSLGPTRLRAETASIVGCHGLARALRARNSVG